MKIEAPCPTSHSRFPRPRSNHLQLFKLFLLTCTPIILNKVFLLFLKFLSFIYYLRTSHYARLKFNSLSLSLTYTNTHTLPPLSI